MKLSFFEPLPALAPYVKSVWMFESRTGLPLSQRSVVAPNGSPKLVISCRNSIVVRAGDSVSAKPDRTAYFLGVRDVPVTLSTEPYDTSFIGVEFHPHGAYPLFSIPMSELANRLATLQELVGARGGPDETMVWSTENAAERVRAVQTMLATRLVDVSGVNSIVDYCLNRIRSTRGLLPIVELESETGYSRRYLEILFKTHIGISPKVFSRITRFQSLYPKWAHELPDVTVMDELYDAYYDQAHFTREFRRMTGFSPVRYIRDVTNEFGHLLVDH